MTPLRFNSKTGELQISGGLRHAISALGQFWRELPGNARRSFGLDPKMTWFWPRWLFLRAVGILGMFAFLSWAGEVDAYFGPNGLFPGGDLYREPGLLNLAGALARTPTLFWFTSGAWLPNALVGAGLLASVSLIFNVLPRVSLLVAWLSYLSLCSPSRALAGIQLDPLQIEVFFLSMFVAPAGFRPGLALDQPANRFAMLLLRLTALKVMLGSGLCKFTTGDSFWWSFTAMDIMYETAPFPAVLGYLSHLLPHWYHVGETLMMMAAELGTPLLLLFCGKRAKLVGLAIWSAFQLGIEANCNFGWLNIAAIGSALVLLDDAFVVSVFPKLAMGAAAPKKTRGLFVRVFTSIVLSLSLLSSAVSAPGHLLPDDVKVPGFINWLNLQLAPLIIGNPLGLYRHMSPKRYVVVVEGSGDGGKTWREYLYRYLPQNLHAMSPYHAPFMARFDNAMHVAALSPSMGSPLMHSLARKLEAGHKEVAALFLENPFPDRPPDIVRIAVYEYSFTNAAEFRETGRYWNRRLSNIWPLH